MTISAYQKAVDYYLENRTPVNIRCMKSDPDSENEIIFCSKLIMTNEPECYCEAYINPDAKWKLGDCPATDLPLRTVETKEEKKVRVGQQKQSRKKRNRRG